MYSVAALDPEASLLRNEVQEQRRLGARTIVAKRGIRDGLDPSWVADILAVLLEPRIYFQLVLQSCWSRTHSEVWLAETIKSRLLSGEMSTLASDLRRVSG